MSFGLPPWQLAQRWVVALGHARHLIVPRRMANNFLDCLLTNPPLMAAHTGFRLRETRAQGIGSAGGGRPSRDRGRRHVALLVDVAGRTGGVSDAELLD